MWPQITTLDARWRFAGIPPPHFIDKNKKDLAEEIENLGIRCQDLTKRPVVKPKETDYLVIGGNGYNDSTNGGNYKKVAKWNEQNPSKKIPIIH